MKAAIKSPTATAAKQEPPVDVYGLQISLPKLADDFVGSLDGAGLPDKWE